MKYSYWSHVKFKARNFMCTSNAAQWSYHISSFIYFLIILNADFTSPPLVKNPTSSLYSIHDLVFYFYFKSNRKKLSTLHLGTCCQLVPCRAAFLLLLELNWSGSYSVPNVQLALKVHSFSPIRVYHYSSPLLYPWDICSKTPNGLLKLQTAPNAIYSMFFSRHTYRHTYDKV